MLELIKNILWSPVTVILIVLVGARLSVKNKFRALKNPKDILKNTLLSKSLNGNSFEAMCTALGGTIGVGNTIGVASAIVEGGPGALFWMLLASVPGMIIKESEIFLAVKFKPIANSFSGPMYYIERGIGNKIFANIWAVSCIFTAFGMGNFSQSMAAVSSINTVTHLSKTAVSILVSFVVLIIITKGLNSIKKTLGACIPVITVIFVFVSLLVLFLQREALLSAVISIFKSAFNFKSGISGIKWSLFISAIRAGFSRGIFTNEAGLGSACIVHSSSNETNPAKQATWGVVEVFIDTVLICTITGLMILCCEVPQNINRENITLYVFQNSLGNVGGSIYSVSMLIFALSSILAWYFYAECSLKYLNVNNKYITLFKIMFALSSFLGGVINAEKILYISDIFNAVMLITNLIALFALSNETKSD